MSTIKVEADKHFHVLLLMAAFNGEDVIVAVAPKTGGMVVFDDDAVSNISLLAMFTGRSEAAVTTDATLNAMDVSPNAAVGTPAEPLDLSKFDSVTFGGISGGALKIPVEFNSYGPADTELDAAIEQWAHDKAVTTDDCVVLVNDFLRNRGVTITGDAQPATH